MSIAVFDVGGTFIKYGIVTDGKLTNQNKVPTPKTNQEDFLQAVENVLQTMKNITGIAFSLPGVMDTKRKYIFAGGSLKYNNRTDVKIWEKRLKKPITIENDARCAVLAEMELGHLQGVQNGMVLTFGTGVGGGIVIQGKLYKGSHLIAGEVSVIISKEQETWGSKSMFGSIGSVLHLVENIAKAKGSNTRDGKEIFSWIEANDEIATIIFEEYCKDVVTNLHTLQCILDPSRICIGGGASENPIFIEGIKKAQEKFYNAFPISFPRAEIVKCRFQNDANLLGAYLNYKQNAKN